MNTRDRVFVPPIETMDNFRLIVGAVWVAVLLGILLPVIPMWSDLIIILGGIAASVNLIGWAINKAALMMEIRKFRRELDEPE